MILFLSASITFLEVLYFGVATCRCYVVHTMTSSGRRRSIGQPIDAQTLVRKRQVTSAWAGTIVCRGGDEDEDGKVFFTVLRWIPWNVCGISLYPAFFDVCGFAECNGSLDCHGLAVH